MTTQNHPVGIRAAILCRIERHCVRIGISERAFGLDVNGNHRLVKSIRDGKATLATLETVEAYLTNDGQKSTRKIPDNVPVMRPASRPAKRRQGGNARA